MSKSESTSVFVVNVGDIAIHFYRQYRKQSGKTYFYAVASVNGKSRTKYVGKELPGEKVLTAIARSMVVSEFEWKNRNKKSDRRPKKLDAPNPALFPPEQYPHMYEPGAVEKIQVKRLTSECEQLRRKITAIAEQVAGLEVVVESQADEVKRLKFENAALFGANKSLTQEIKVAEDALKLYEFYVKQPIKKAVEEGIRQSKELDGEIASLALQLVQDVQLALDDKRLEPLGVAIAQKALRYGEVICTLLNAENIDG